MLKPCDAIARRLRSISAAIFTHLRDARRTGLPFAHLPTIIHLALTFLTACAEVRHLRSLNSAFLASFLAARHLPHRLTPLRTLPLLLRLLSTGAPLIHSLLPLCILPLTLLHHLPSIGPLLLTLRRSLTLLRSLLPSAAHLLTLLTLRSLTLNALLPSAAHLLALRRSLALNMLSLLRSLTLRSGLTLRHLPLNLLLATSTISSTALMTAATAAPTALTEQITAGTN